MKNSKSTKEVTKNEVRNAEKLGFAAYLAKVQAEQEALKAEIEANKVVRTKTTNFNISIDFMLRIRNAGSKGIYLHQILDNQKPHSYVRNGKQAEKFSPNSVGRDWGTKHVLIQAKNQWLIEQGCEVVFEVVTELDKPNKYAKHSTKVTLPEIFVAEFDKFVKEQTNFKPEYLKEYK